MVTLASDGTVSSRGAVSDVLAHDIDLAQEAERQAEELGRAEQMDSKNMDSEGTTTADATQTKAGKLVVEEEVLEGHVSWSTRTSW